MTEGAVEKPVERLPENLSGGERKDIYAGLLQAVASNLAITYADVAKKFSNAPDDDLKSHLTEMVNSGLVNVQSPKGKEIGDDAVLSITADGSKKADALRNRGIAAFVGRLK
jgi:hypothetical protein